MLRFGASTFSKYLKDKMLTKTLRETLLGEIQKNRKKNFQKNLQVIKKCVSLQPLSENDGDRSLKILKDTRGKEN